MRVSSQCSARPSSARAASCLHQATTNGKQSEKLRPCGAVEPSRIFLWLQKDRHAVVNAAGELVGRGYDQRAGEKGACRADVEVWKGMAPSGRGIPAQTSAAPCRAASRDGAVGYTCFQGSG